MRREISLTLILLLVINTILSIFGVIVLALGMGVFVSAQSPTTSSSSSGNITLYFFYTSTCPHCTNEIPFLEKLEQKYPQLEVKYLDVGRNEELFKETCKKYETVPAGVPRTFVCNKAFVGFTNEDGELTYHESYKAYKGHKNQIENAVIECIVDLSINSSDISFTDSNPRKYEVINISAIVHNKGKGNKSDILVRFYSGDPERDGKRIGERIIPLIEVNSSKKTKIEWNVSKTTDIYVVVDPENEIAESDEDNNIAFKRLNVEESDYFMYLTIGAIIVICILSMIVLFAVYKALTYKKSSKDNIECPRCGMILPIGTRKCPVCGNEIKWEQR